VRRPMKEHGIWNWDAEDTLGSVLMRGITQDFNV